MASNSSEVDLDLSVSLEVQRKNWNEGVDNRNLHSPKLSLSQYGAQRSLTSSGEETLASTSKEQNGDTAVCNTGPKTSTPNKPDLNLDAEQGAVGFSPVGRHETNSTDSSSDGEMLPKKKVTFINPLEVRVPLAGFEVMEQRAKFTVFKLHVHKGNRDNWFVFRRYSDFEQLQKKVKKRFPMFRISLPPKRWFRDNYEKDFLDDRMLGLQAFVDSILCHSDLCNCPPVQEFFCFCDPPGPHDSIEESRAYCDELEDSVYSLKKECHAKDVEIDLLKEELGLYKRQVEMLSQALREANTSSANNEETVPSPVSSLAECDLMAPEADQSKPMSLKDEILQSEALRLREEAQAAVKTQNPAAKSKYKNGSAGSNKKGKAATGVKRILPPS